MRFHLSQFSRNLCEAGQAVGRIFVWITLIVLQFLRNHIKKMRLNATAATPGGFIARRSQKIFVVAALAVIFVVFVFYGSWTTDLRLFFSTTQRGDKDHHLENIAREETSFETYNNFDQASKVWFRINCLRTLTSGIGIGNISVFVNAVKTSGNPICRKWFKTFSDVYSVRDRSAPVVIPDTFSVKVLGWLGNNKDLLREASLQHITSVDNLYTQESTVFNPLRAKRPGAGGGATLETKKYVADILKNTALDCDFCNYKTMTAEDPFGTVESQYSVTVSNTFKVEKFHGLVIWKHHNPLDIKQHELLDAMDTAQRWFQLAHSSDKKYIIPHIYWDTLPKASASQIHPHFHVTLARDYYYSRWNRLYTAAKQYALDHDGENYFTALNRIHSALGLAVQFGNASVMAYLTPTASHEIVLISKTPCEDLFRLLYFCLAAFRYDMGLYAISAGMVFPKLIPSSDGSDLPALIRLVYRGPAEAVRADIDSLQLFGTVNVNVDPYMVIDKIKRSINLRVAR